MKYLGFLSMLILMISCKTKSAMPDQKAQLDKMLQNYYEQGLKLYPMNATYAGIKGYNDILPNNISEEFKEEERAFYTRYKDSIATIDYAALSENDKISIDILNWECDINLEAANYPTELTPIDQMWTMQLTIGQLASGASSQPFENTEDYENWLKRIDQYISWTDTAISNMKKGIEQGYVLPRPLIEKVIPQLESLDHGPVDEHLFFSPAKELPEIVNVRMKDRYRDMVANKIIPTYKKLSTFFKEEYLPVGRTSTGIDALANGEAFYNHKIRQYTTTGMTSDEIHELGKSEVARLLNEMQKVMDQVGFRGTKKEFFKYVRNKPELMHFTDAQQVIENFNTIHEKMKPNLARLFDLTPKSPFEVRRTEAFREASASAEYNPGSLDGTRPGIFYVPLPDVTKYNKYDAEDLFLHEAIPGHHYQISLQQENEKLPEFRKTLWYSSYGEGWALYCESLGKELGLYEDPYQYFGMLSAEMHRAIRLVVDTGMHAKGMTSVEAIQYSLDNEAESEAGIISEIERYMAEPGQALSYKIGQLKILELRKRSEEKLGDKFDIKKFHNIMLESGCVPLKVLESKVDRWIASF